MKLINLWVLYGEGTFYTTGGDQVRKNNKKQVFSNENSIQKSNEISMAKLNNGLTLNQMQLLAFAIYSTQKNGKTEFNKPDFEKKFGIEYKAIHARDDTKKLRVLGFDSELENEEFYSLNVFQRIDYKKGLFAFKWTDDMIPHILELKEKYVTTDLTITSQFKSSFSWTLYDYLKAHYGYWHKPISKESLMKLFSVENVKSYQKNTGLFRQKVLDVAIKEINKYTELEVRYDTEKEGRSIIGFDLIWSTGENQTGATKKQIKELKVTVDTIIRDSLIFIDLNDEHNRQRAITIVQETKSMIPHTNEPIYITYEKADEMIQKANNNLKELNGLLSLEGKDNNLYYNWLEDEVEN